MKQNSRRDPSLSSQREKVNTRCLDKVDDQEVKDRHSFLSSRLSSKIAFMKNSRMPFKNVSMMAQSNGKNSKSGKRVPTNNNPNLSNKKQKDIMKKLKEFFNPLKEDFSNKSIDTDEKISLTFNQSIAFLFRFRSAYTEMATGTHERNQLKKELQMSLEEEEEEEEEKREKKKQQKTEVVVYTSLTQWASMGQTH